MTLDVIIALSSNLTFTGNTNFLDNSAQCRAQGGAIYASDNTVLGFSGTSSFINNSADNVGGLVGGSTHPILYLTLAEPATSTIQQSLVLVVRSSHQTILHLASVEPAGSSATQHMVVVQSIHITLHLTSMEPAASSTTPQIMLVVQSIQLAILKLASVEQTTSLAT